MSITELQRFMQLFKFQAKMSGLLGVEREWFIVNRSGIIVPCAELVLRELNDPRRFGYELSACQGEDRAGPLEIGQIRKAMTENDCLIEKVLTSLGLGRSHCEVAPSDMPPDIYPDPTGRYQRIVESRPPEVISAALRIISAQVNIGMPSHDTALAVYNGVIEHTEELCQLGCNSGGERLRLYKLVEPEYMPPSYESWQAFYADAVQKGFDKNPKDCWHLIRMTGHGTIEFRMFGTTPDTRRIESWAKCCHELCLQFL